MPEAEKISSDAYLFGLAPAFGIIRRIAEPQALYRFHGQNMSKVTTFEKKVKKGMSMYDSIVSALKDHFERRGHRVDTATWRANGWWPRIHDSVEEIRRVVPRGCTFVLVDEDNWGTGAALDGRPRMPFLERDGQYWGPPADDETAIRELDRLRQVGADYLIFAWPAFWWLDHYSGLRSHVRSHFRCLLENDRIIIFRL
jgi:hypothetical protein